MKNKLYVAVLFAISLNSCTDDNCSKIEFTDSVEFVQSNVLELDSTLKSMNTQCNAKYDILFNKDEIVMRDENISYEYTPELFCSYNKDNASKMLRIVKNLKKNHINAVFLENGVYVYNSDLCNPDNEFELVRYIIIGDDSRISSRFVILDTNGKLVLIAPSNK